jgi:2-polyprenyl-6-methoxyphenol hydroxylase-like FAD-dependent oxidoreductase
MAVTRRGYVGLVCVESGNVNVAAALDPARVRERGLAGAAVEILGAAGVAGADELAAADWHGTGPLTRHPADVALERLLAIGDAAGYVEPFTGEGMSWAFESALAVAPLALEAIGDWHALLAERWRRSYRRRIASRQRWCRAISIGLRHPLLLRGAARLLAARPALARPLVDRVSGGTAEPYVELPLEEGS